MIIDFASRLIKTIQMPVKNPQDTKKKLYLF